MFILKMVMLKITLAGCFSVMWAATKLLLHYTIGIDLHFYYTLWYRKAFVSINMNITTLQPQGQCPSPSHQPGGFWLQLHISHSLSYRGIYVQTNPVKELSKLGCHLLCSEKHILKLCIYWHLLRLQKHSW